MALIEKAQKTIHSNYDEKDQNHTVGAAILCESGNIYVGVNDRKPEKSKQNICCLLLIIRKTRSNYTILIRFPTNTAATGITTTQAIAPNIIDTQFWNNIFEFNNVSSV